ncbi:hypothetical protein PR002_g660 [Phytophthora rubi]|nr:hypothetical protein PR002_g660 [Phytophthora rubi]
MKHTTDNALRHKLYKRTAVFYQHKLDVLVVLDTVTIEEAVSHFHPEMNRGERPNEKRQYYAWFVVRATIEVKCSSGFRLHCRDRNGGMGATLPSATVVQLVEWINLLPADGVPVTALMLMRQALESYRGTVLHFLIVATDHQLDPESITCYYEAALIAAIRHQLPNVAIDGCLFHWKQEIRRRMKKPRLHDAQAGFAMECGAIDMLTVIPVTQVAISASHTSSSTFSIAATRNMSCTPRPSGPHVGAHVSCRAVERPRHTPRGDQQD